MKVHIIKERTIYHFYTIEQPASKISFVDWLTKSKMADWNIPADIKSTFPTADLLGNSSNRVIFNIAGNSYRMIAKYAFGETEAHLFICWIGTHSEYDKLCKEGKQYTINVY